MGLSLNLFVLDGGSLYLVLILLVFLAGELFNMNQLLCFGCFAAFCANFSQSICLLAASVSILKNFRLSL